MAENAHSPKEPKTVAQQLEPDLQHPDGSWRKQMASEAIVDARLKQYAGREPKTARGFLENQAAKQAVPPEQKFRDNLTNRMGGESADQAQPASTQQAADQQPTAEQTFAAALKKGAESSRIVQVAHSNATGHGNHPSYKRET